MDIETINSVNDKRLEQFRYVVRRGENDDTRFVVEGWEPVQRLVRWAREHERYQVDCVLCEQGWEDRCRDILQGLSHVNLYTASQEVFEGMMGYRFSRGCMAYGSVVRPYDFDDLGEKEFLLVCEHVENEENLGVMIRTAKAMGVGGVLLGGKGVSAYARRVIRVSMGNVFGLPVVRSTNFLKDIKRIKQKGHVVLGADVSGRAIDVARFEGRVNQKGIVLVMGNEPNGLSDEVRGLCDEMVIVPIDENADSLNVGVAAGILMYELRDKK
ncbi:Putative TrmH family tRNA/rRNA methyltransferase [Poriferisphaera corsica]|uniref:TrmH family tRNA/rRNA methyltransferase n=1 Tax=Poriferisphaera corsica TaxID=2528020 RepID=A0A517YWA7_9BACT|nr:RNA methyltransferase [Poriferisphaera corsica]QDU34497.1 Putative TrmH family tRNA/rRNA methyltransferase [Poriferisphaera corsica]